MNKLFFIFFTVCITITNSHSQNSFGIKGGANLCGYRATFHSETVLFGVTISESKPIIAYHAGAYAKLQLNEYIGFQPELLYIIKGGEYYTELGIITGYDEITQVLQYIEIPLGFYYGKIKGTNFDIGLSPSFLIGAKNRLYSNSSGTNLSDEDTEAYNSFDLGMFFGLAHELENGLNFNFRYSFALTSLYKVNDYYNTPDFKNHVFSVGVGYSFSD